MEVVTGIMGGRASLCPRLRACEPLDGACQNDRCADRSRPPALPGPMADERDGRDRREQGQRHGQRAPRKTHDRPERQQDDERRERSPDDPEFDPDLQRRIVGMIHHEPGLMAGLDPRGNGKARHPGARGEARADHRLLAHHGPECAPDRGPFTGMGAGEGLVNGARQPGLGERAPERGACEHEHQAGGSKAGGPPRCEPGCAPRRESHQEAQRACPALCDHGHRGDGREQHQGAGTLSGSCQDEEPGEDRDRQGEDRHRGAVEDVTRGSRTQRTAMVEAERKFDEDDRASEHESPGDQPEARSRQALRQDEAQDQRTPDRQPELAQEMQGDRPRSAPEQRQSRPGQKAKRRKAQRRDERGSEISNDVAEPALRRRAAERAESRGHQKEDARSVRDHHGDRQQGEEDHRGAVKPAGSGIFDRRNERMAGHAASPPRALRPEIGDRRPRIGRSRIRAARRLLMGSRQGLLVQALHGVHHRTFGEAVKTR
jgi:hypothetical protein